MLKRETRDEEEAKLKSWSAVLSPIRFREVFLPSVESEDIEEIDVAPEEFGAIEKFLETLDQTKSMTGS